MNKVPSYKHYYDSSAKTLDVILHGGSHGLDSSLIQKVFETSEKKGNSVIAFNFPYFERGEEQSSGEQLLEELDTLKEILSIAQSDNYLTIRLIGKSLGGIVASYWLNSLSKERREKYEVVILGYVTGSVLLKEFEGKITIIQGEKDKFGDISIVKKDLESANSNQIEYHEIEGADHSYRVPETKEPIYEDKVIEVLNSL